MSGGGSTLVGMVATATTLHVAGPVEDESWPTGATVPVVRCLACDVLLWIAWLDGTGASMAEGEIESAPELGKRVELPAEPCPGHSP